MNKEYYSLGLMSGTSLDGIDASIILSDGENKLEIIDNYYEKYDDKFKLELRKFINQATSIDFINKNKSNYSELEKKITLLHISTSQKILEKNKDINIDLIGFHGQTILHSPSNKFSIQMGNPILFSEKIKKKVCFNFREKDIQNGGEGAPLSPIYHYLIFKKLKFTSPTIFLNLGGVANITFIDKNEEIYSTDIGPGNCLIDQWIRDNSKKNFDLDGLIAKSGKTNKTILNKAIHNWRNDFIKKSLLNKSYDIKDFNISFIKGLNLKDGAATITEYTSQILADYFNNIEDDKIKIIICGGGRKNNFLLRNIFNKTKFQFELVDKYNINGDFIESQAFGYLAIRSYLKKNISFPSTTGVKNSISGGQIFENF